MTHIKGLARTKSSESGKVNQDQYRTIVRQQLEEVKEAYASYEIVKTGEDRLAGKDSVGKKYVNYLQFFKRLGVVPLTPILMDLIKFSQGHRTDKEIMKEVLGCLHTLQSFVARRVLAGIPPQQLRSSVSSLAKDLGQFTSECTTQNLESYRRKLNEILVKKGTDRFPSDSALLSNPNRDIYNRTGKKESLFVVIWELQRELSREDEANLIPAYGTAKDAFSIEHILPQGTKKNDKDQEVMDLEWRKLWDNWEVMDPELQFMSTVHSIGNLTLLQNQVNSMVSNLVFDQKKKIYKDNTRLKLSDDVLVAEKWTPDEITARANKLLNLAIKRWPYPEVN
jgi:hypothetical protein